MNNVQIILGPPGTGKTTKLLSIVDEALKSGIRPEHIAYVSFTRKAAHEAKTRAEKKFNMKGFTHFKTLHSMAFHQLSLTKKRVMHKDHVRDFAEEYNLELSDNFEYSEMQFMGTTPDDKSMSAENLSRITMKSIGEIVEESSEDLAVPEIQYVRASLNAYKEKHNILDFTDFLEQAIKYDSWPVFKILVVDEAQDLSLLQWKYVELLAEDVDNVYIAGDDDQAIYKWNGADANYLQTIDAPRKVLNQSYRVPHCVHHLASKVISEVSNRINKFWKPRQGAEGDIHYYGSVDQLDLEHGNWYVLARNDYMLNEVKAMCQAYGYNYSYKGRPVIGVKMMKAIVQWERWRKKEQADIQLIKPYVKNVLTDAEFYKLDGDLPWYDALDNITPFNVEYIRGMMRNGEKLGEEPRITISTIHGVKGGEADNVALITDMSAKTYENYVENPDDENRVLYVALTRTRETLHLIDPQTDMCYEIN